MISCPKCGKENQPHYKFCLGCGAELPRDGAPKPYSPQTPPGGMPKQPAQPAQAAPAPAPEPAAQPYREPAAEPAAPAIAAAVAVAAAPVIAPSAPAPAPSEAPAAAGQVGCGQCGHVNPANNMFCASCGFRLAGAQPVAASAPPPQAFVSEPPPTDAQPPPAAASLTVVLTALRADGSEAGAFQLAANINVIGRETGGIFAADSYLSPRHATFTIKEGRLFVRDESSLNGVYVRLRRDTPVDLYPNDVFRIGQEIIKFEPLKFPEPSPDGVQRLGAPAQGYVGRIALVIGRETNGNAFPVPETGVHLGRERGDVLFPEDGYVSGLHCRIACEGGKTYLTDLGSSNGTFLRLREEIEVHSGEVLLMGQQLFRVTLSA